MYFSYSKYVMEQFYNEIVCIIWVCHNLTFSYEWPDCFHYFFYYKKMLQWAASYIYFVSYVCKYFCWRDLSHLIAVLNGLHVLRVDGYCHIAMWSSKKVEPVYTPSGICKLLSFLPSSSPTRLTFAYLLNENGISLFNLHLFAH